MILVTGCAGFIGSKVCRHLLDAGEAVVGVDNLNEAYDPRVKRWRLGQLDGRPGFQFRMADVTDRKALEALFAGQRSGRSQGGAPFAAVVNLAAHAGVRQSVEDPWVYYGTNVTGVLNLLDLCRQSGVPKFIQASTSSVYGSPQTEGVAGGEAGVPFREDMATDRPLSPYAASKKAAELLCYTYWHLHGINVTVLRFFTVYGPAGRPDMSIFRFVRWISEGETLLLYGDGTQQRDFTYVEDVARGTCLALEHQGFDVINLGSDRPVSVGEVIRTLEGMLERKAVIERRPAHPADVRKTWANIEKARSLLSWEPTVPLEEGLQRCVAWYRENREWARGVRV